jgi:FkbM family methyltransferase
LGCQNTENIGWPPPLMGDPMVLGRYFGEKLVGNPAYRPLRYAYQSVFKREVVNVRRIRRAFYAQFITRKDLVFDVGANIGNYTETFCDIAKNVVAVEPDPRNVKVLKQRLSRRAHIEECAMGRTEGTANLHLSDRNDVGVGEGSTVSTLSPSFAKKISGSVGDVIPVRVRTLDSLAEQYGTPGFVKVDAEGYDAEVLSGMHFEPAMVSFEFLPSDLSIARQCVELLRHRVFNVSLEEQCRFALDKWVDAESMLGFLSTIDASIPYGDVFAKTSSKPVG